MTCCLATTSQTRTLGDNQEGNNVNDCTKYGFIVVINIKRALRMYAIHEKIMTSRKLLIVDICGFLISMVFKIR